MGTFYLLIILTGICCGILILLSWEPKPIQNTINEQLKLTGNDGKFNITVAQQGQIWTVDHNRKGEGVLEANLPMGKYLEIESLKNYILQFEKVEKENKLYLTIEDRINRYSLEFVNPHLDKNNQDILYGEPMRGMLAKGPELKMKIIPGSDYPNNSQIHVDIVRGKKQMFEDNLLINPIDTNRLKRFARENFT